MLDGFDTIVSIWRVEVIEGTARPVPMMNALLVVSPNVVGRVTGPIQSANSASSFEPTRGGWSRQGVANSRANLRKLQEAERVMQRGQIRHDDIRSMFDLERTRHVGDELAVVDIADFLLEQVDECLTHTAGPIVDLELKQHVSAAARIAAVEHLNRQEVDQADPEKCAGPGDELRRPPRVTDRQVFGLRLNSQPQWHTLRQVRDALHMVRC